MKMIWKIEVDLKFDVDLRKENYLKNKDNL